MTGPSHRLRPRLTTVLRSLVVVALATTLAPAASANAADLASCERVVASPEFGRDGTAFCAGVDEHARSYRIYRTTDHAQSWHDLQPVGLPAYRGWISDFLISPLFTTDHLLVLSFPDQVYFSTDAASTFREAPLLAPPVTLVPTSPTPSDPDSKSITSALIDHSSILAVGQHPQPGASGSMLFDPITLVASPVLGTTERDRLFAVPPSGPALAVGATGDSAATTVERVYACDAAFSCRTGGYGFPAGETVDRLTFAADYPQSHVVFATTIDRRTNRIHAYRSANSAASFTRIATLESALSDVFRAGAQAAVAFAPTAMTSKTIYVRVSAGITTPTPPSERLFRSDNGGTTWRLVAYGRMPYAAGPRGTMPYAFAYAATEGRPTPRGLLLNTDASRLLMSGAWPGHGRTVWCSLNGGTSWSPHCLHA